MPHDVVIAGAGPVGLFLACELALAGVSVLVLERNPSQHTALKSGALGGRGLNFPSAEAFYRRGLLNRVKAAAIGWVGDDPPQPPANPSTAEPSPPFIGHFAGITLDPAKLDFSPNVWTLPGPSMGGGMVSLGAVEQVLADHATALGVELRYGHELTSFTETIDGLTIHTPQGDFPALWLVGCDGGRSAVRKLAGFAFEGTEPEFTAWSAIVEFADTAGLQPGFHLTPNGLYIYNPGRIGVVDFDNPRADRSTIELDALQALLRRVSGTQVTLKSIQLSTSWTDRARQATTYRQGRVLLAGDAAHIHSPFGGQGMNTGLGDAMNLGWKLAATIHGHAPTTLLDTYTAERHPIGAWVLDWTRAQVACIRPDPHAHAIAAVIRDLIATRDGTNYFMEKISGLNLRYDLGDPHPLVGRSAPDFVLKDISGNPSTSDTRLGGLLHTGRGVLLDFTASPSLVHICNPYSDRLAYISARAGQQLNLGALLIRPDGFVAWAANADTSPAPSAASQAITRWFGAPA